MQTVWEALGISRERVESHYGTMEEILLRELMRYPEDGSFRALEEAVKDGQCEGIRRAAHAVKGLWRMLLMDALAQAAQEVEDCARAGDLPGAVQRMPALKRAHDRMLQRLAGRQKGGTEDENCCL